MKRAGILGVAMILTLGLVAGTTHAAKPKKVPSEVDFYGIDFPPPDMQLQFVGNVYAKKAKCVRNRSVTIFGTPKGETTREAIATTTTDKTGDWRIHPDPSPVGTYEAEVAKKKVKKNGKKLICKPDISPSFFWAS
jgi:hypothetical protein